MNKPPAPAAIEDGPPGGERSVAVTGDNIGVIATGDHVRISQFPALSVTPMEQVDAPAGLINLPQRSTLFVGRDEDLRRLRETLSLSSGTVLVTAVYGLGGIGKSTLASHYAQAHRDEYCLVWWITADTRAALETGLAKLAVALQPAVAGVALEQQVEHALRWLTTHRGWLLILDNVQDAADVAALLARLAGGQVLITSRRTTGWHKLGTAIDIGVLETGPAVALLTQMLQFRDASPGIVGASAVCEQMGFLPLAIEQAGAYMAETGTTPLEYLDLLDRYPATMYQETAEGGDAQHTMARIWRVTLDHLASTPLAGQVLRMLAWCAPDDIPVALLAGLAEERLLRKAIGRLTAYSMITYEQGLVSIHRLVQAVSRTADSDDPYRTADRVGRAREDVTHALSQRLVSLNPRSPDDWPAFQALLPHVQALLRHAEEATDTADTLIVLHRVGTFLSEHGQLDDALTYRRRYCHSSEHIHGSDHPETLASRNYLAGAYEAAGDLGRAILLYEAVVADHLRVLGADHPDTLASRNYLAGAYEAAGDLGRAIPLYEAVVADHLRVLGADHTHTLHSRHNLAHAYQVAGTLGRSIPLYEAVTADYLRVLGADHPDTLNSRHNLAQAYQIAGDLGRAIPLYEAVTADRVRVLGADHPQTLVARCNLAGAFEAAGDLGRAIPLYEAVTADHLRVLGADHPDTLASRNNLAYAAYAVGDLETAIPLFEAVTPDLLRVLGADHPHTLTSRNNLAYAYQAAGDLGRAISLYEAVLADRVRVLGVDHPDTLIARNNLAYAFYDAGDLETAIPLLEAVTADHQRVLGTDHPDTLTSRNNLAAAYEVAGDLGRAIPLYEAVAADCLRVLGADHPDTLASQSNLASGYRAAGDLERAILLWEAVAADAQRVLGRDHPVFKSINANLHGIRKIR